MNEMKIIDAFLEKHFKTVMAVILVGVVIVYAVLAVPQNIWYDEAFTMGTLRHGFADMWKITAADVHPPLYYILLKIFMLPFGENEFAARIFSVISYVIIIAFGGVQIKKLFSKKSAVLFMLIMCMFPYLTEYAFEIRMYAVAALFVFFCAVFAYKAYLYNKPLDWVLYTLFGVAAAYTHYFAFVSVGAIFFLLLLALTVKKHKGVKCWLLCSAAAIVLYLPWAKSFIEQLAYKVNNDYWIDAITVKTVVSYVYNLFSASGMKTFAIFAAAAYAAVFAYAMIFDKEIRLLGICAAGVPIITLLVGVGASVLVRPVFVLRYLMPSLPVILAFIAIAMGRMRSESLLVSALTVMVMGCISNLGMLAYAGYVKPDTMVIDKTLADRYADCKDVAVRGLKRASSHFPGLLAYSMPDARIYSSYEPPGSPWAFDNLENINDLDLNGTDTLLLLIPEKTAVPEEYSANFKVEYKEKLETSEVICDAYLLTR